MTVDHEIEPLGLDESREQVSLVTVDQRYHGSVQLEAGEFATDLEMVVFGELFGKQDPIAVVVPENTYEWSFKMGEPGDYERCDVVTGMENIFDPLLVVLFDGNLYRSPAIVGVGDDPDPHDEDGLASSSDMGLYQGEPGAGTVVAGSIFPTWT